MYQNIVFDLGGVVVQYDPRKYLLDLLMDAAAEREVYDIVFGSEEWAQMDAGQMTFAEAEAVMLAKAKEKGRSFEVRTVLDDWMKMLKPIHRTL